MADGLEVILNGLLPVVSQLFGRSLVSLLQNSAPVGIPDHRPILDVALTIPIPKLFRAVVLLVLTQPLDVLSRLNRHEFCGHFFFLFFLQLAAPAA